MKWLVLVAVAVVVAMNPAIASAEEQDKQCWEAQVDYDKIGLVDYFFKSWGGGTGVQTVLVELPVVDGRLQVPPVSGEYTGCGLTVRSYPANAVTVSKCYDWGEAFSHLYFPCSRKFQMTAGGATSQKPLVQSQPPVAAVCSSGMLFISDVSLPDGAVLNPGQSAVKTWRLKNSGSCAWQSGLKLVPVAGDGLGGEALLSSEVAPGGMAEFSVQIVAPNSPGSYKGFWQMKDLAGRAIGSQIYAQIKVVVPLVVATPTRVLIQLSPTSAEVVTPVLAPPVLTGSSMATTPVLPTQTPVIVVVTATQVVIVEVLNRVGGITVTIPARQVAIVVVIVMLFGFLLAYGFLSGRLLLPQAADIGGWFHRGGQQPPEPEFVRPYSVKRSDPAPTSTPIPTPAQQPNGGAVPGLTAGGLAELAGMASAGKESDRSATDQPDETVVPVDSVVYRRSRRAIPPPEDGEGDKA